MRASQDRVHIQSPVETRRIWSDFGRRDPLWYVLSSRGRRGGKWSEDDFFRTGRHSVDLVLRSLSDLNIHLKTEVALDFGCGVGRLTQALAEHFELVYGVDASPTMIAHAEAYNRHGSACRFLVNNVESLSMFPECSFDIVLSDVTLQHVRPEVSKHYVEEFLRVLRPGGVAVFFLPGRLVRRGLAPWIVALYNWVRFREASTLDYGVDESEVIRQIQTNRATLLGIQRGDWLDRGQDLSGPAPGLRERLWLRIFTTLTDHWEGEIYLVRRDPLLESAIAPPSGAKPSP
jgi:SAM-dependent methyltransferase